MDWMQQIDAYCERVGPGYWVEPANALSNLAFLAAAAVMAWRLRGQTAPLARAMVVILAAIGVGSYLWHTHARAWAGVADVAPILVFILLYIYAVHAEVWGMKRLWSLVLTALFFPYAAVLVPVFSRLPGFSESAGYWPVPLLIAGHAAFLHRRAPGTARGLALGAGLLVVSLVFRSLDAGLCAAWPLGTHPMWHLLNAAMLGWMIEVYRRHRMDRPTEFR